jgi:hypothetical protein
MNPSTSSASKPHFSQQVRLEKNLWVLQFYLRRDELDAGVIESDWKLRKVAQDGDCGADISVSVKAISESDAFEGCIEDTGMTDDGAAATPQVRRA